MRRANYFAFVVYLACAPVFAGAAIPVASANTFMQDNGYPPQDQQQDDQDYAPDPNYQAFAPEELDNLLSPIALYPDPLLAQVLVAATFPDQIDEAARFVRAYGQNGVDSQNWDVSVKAVAHYPSVVGMMADKIDWTTSLGQAYVNQSTDVATSVQRLRHMARSVGNLDSTPQQEVLVHDDYIAISPYQPQYIYVPVYDPAICYYRRPAWGSAISFGTGFAIGAWLNLDFRWGYRGRPVYYTGWHPGGWGGGGGCWNCGWINRSRTHVTVVNNIYINNRYRNVTVNRNVVNRRVNVTNINHYNYIHKNVTYNNVQVNNTRIVNRGGRPGDNRPGNNRPGDSRPGNNGRPGNSPGNNNRPGNKIIDRNIDRNNPRIDQYRGRDNRPDRPSSAQRPAVQPGQSNRPQVQPNRPAPQARPTPQPRPTPHTFNSKENNFDPRVTSQRGQSSREQARPQARPTPQARPSQQARPAQQPKPQNRPAPQPRGEKRKP